ncbi:hypothetical protein D7V64_02675 [Acinetobacter cumulans]|uniref:Uncharacterized protein n=1 Tax=Acinetobacter cumulans TaxID=2136182 RepID=A0A3A8GB77_9GAMM|nr:hypothetical protein D7V64_02675 [Acinetobacter cumulans]
MKVGARFKLASYKADGSASNETPWSNNLVLNSGLARMSSGTWIDRCVVGSGNSQPIPEQVALDNFLAKTATITNSVPIISTTAPYYYGVRVTWRFAEGVAAGNISEVGLGWGDNNLWNRALIKDTSGSPATITVLSDEYLDVISEVRLYPSSGNASFNLIDGENIISEHTVTSLPCVPGNPGAVFEKIEAPYLYIYNGAAGTSINALPTGTESSVNSVVTTYPTQTSVKSVFSIDLTSANMQHKSLKLGYAGLFLRSNSLFNIIGYKMELTPPITKTSDQKMSYTFELSWGRYS